MNVKIDFFDLKNLYFDTKHVQFGYVEVQMVHEGYLLGGRMTLED